MMKKVIFLCSANYFRSRFAEHLFNHLAGQKGIPWRAESRGLAVGRWGDLGNISPHSLRALKVRGVPIHGAHRDPMPLSLDDLATADLVIAMKQSEHRAMIRKQFPAWKDRVEYWNVDDLDCAFVQDSLRELQRQVQALVDRLENARILAASS